jgi:hypothetical protein
MRVQIIFGGAAVRVARDDDEEVGMWGLEFRRALPGAAGLSLLCVPSAPAQLVQSLEPREAREGAPSESAVREAANPALEATPLGPKVAIAYAVTESRPGSPDERGAGTDPADIDVDGRLDEAA